MNQPDHILMVDDEPLLRQSTELILTQAGYAVRSAETGQEGLELFHLYGCDLLILDQKLPDMQGNDLLAQVRQEAPSVPVIVLSGAVVESIKAEAEQLGVWAYLDKPIDPQELLTHIQKALQSKIQ